jgi:hypothetical protein
MNYTRPKDPDHIDSSQEWLNSALIFAKTLGLILEEGMGVVVKLQGDMKNPVGDSDKVIVFKVENQIHIDNFDQDLTEGTFCKIATE